MVERRQEPRAQVDLAVQVSGRDANGTPFTQTVTATNTSRNGALLSGLSREIRSGDLVMVEYQQRKARFKVVWVRDSQSPHLKTQAAVHRMEKEECPWPTSGAVQSC
jgi:PilZ domain